MEADVSIPSENGMRGDSIGAKPQVKRSEEGAQLLLPAESASAIANSGNTGNGVSSMKLSATLKAAYSGYN